MASNGLRAMLHKPPRRCECSATCRHNTIEPYSAENRYPGQPTVCAPGRTCVAPTQEKPWEQRYPRPPGGPSAKTPQAIRSDEQPGALTMEVTRLQQQFSGEHRGSERDAGRSPWVP